MADLTGHWNEMFAAQDDPQLGCYEPDVSQTLRLLDLVQDWKSLLMPGIIVECRGIRPVDRLAHGASVSASCGSSSAGPSSASSSKTGSNLPGRVRANWATL